MSLAQQIASAVQGFCADRLCVRQYPLQSQGRGVMVLGEVQLEESTGLGFAGTTVPIAGASFFPYRDNRVARICALYRTRCSPKPPAALASELTDIRTVYKPTLSTGISCTPLELAR